MHMAVGRRDPEAPAGGPVSDDTAVLAEVRAGRTDTFQLLVDRYKVGLFRYMLYRTGKPEVAEDLAQEVFLRVFKAVRQGTYAGKASVKTWMFTVARNCIRDFWRAGQHNHELTVSGLPDSQIASWASLRRGPAEEAEIADRREIVLRALSELPPEQKEAVYLKFFGGLSIAEVSEVTAAPATTVKARLRYALSKLSDRLAFEMGG